MTAGLTSGCGQDGIKAYTVPKEQPAEAAQAILPADHPDVATAAATPQLKWRTPDGWKELPAGEFRVASFKLTGADGKQADVSVIPLPGAAGGDFSNVNRWRGQVGQSPVTEEELKTLAQPVEVGGEPAKLYEQNGASPNGEPTRILAVVQHRDGTAWFFKMTGDDQLVAQQKPAFVEFLKSIQLPTGGAAAAPPPMAEGSLPAGHPDISAAPAGPVPSAASRAGTPQWEAPSGWKEVPGGQFLVAKFMITGEGGGQAAVNVSQSAGDGGGLPGNVNRWRGQLGLPPLDTQTIADSFDNPTPGWPRYLVDITGTDAKTGKPARLVGAIVPQSAQTWFYKLMGDPNVVAAQKDAFARFVQGVKY